MTWTKFLLESRDSEEQPKGLYGRRDFSLSDHTNENYGEQLLTPTAGSLFGLII